jgi:hypothetical protein
VLQALVHAPSWWLPLVVVFAHAFMIFRGLLFRELSRGGSNRRLEAFRR